MSEQIPERWRELCELAIREPDPRRLTQLLHQIEELLLDADCGHDLPADDVPVVASPEPVPAEKALPSVLAQALAETSVDDGTAGPEGGA